MPRRGSLEGGSEKDGVMSELWEIRVGDCRELLDELPEQSVQCVVTSPPYWGQRDYGVEGMIGLESDVESWVDEIVGVFRKVWRVLRDDGTLWLNLGDKYATNRGNTAEKPGSDNKSVNGFSPPEIPAVSLQRERHPPRQAEEILRFQAIRNCDTHRRAESVY